MLQKEFNRELRNEMRKNHDRIAALVRPLDPEKLVRRPAPDAWSVGEVLEHLALLDGLYLAAIEPLIKAARPDAGAPGRKFVPTFIGRQVAASLEKPKPLKSPKAGRPGTPRGGVAEAFLSGDTKFMALMERASSLDWNAVRMRTPVLPWLPLKMNLGDAFHIHRVHVRRHMGQIERTIGLIK